VEKIGVDSGKEGLIRDGKCPCRSCAIVDETAESRSLSSSRSRIGVASRNRPRGLGSRPCSYAARTKQTGNIRRRLEKRRRRRSRQTIARIVLARNNKQPLDLRLSRSAREKRAVIRKAARSLPAERNPRMTRRRRKKRVGIPFGINKVTPTRLATRNKTTRRCRRVAVRVLLRYTKR